MSMHNNGLSFSTLRYANIHRARSTEKFKECELWLTSQWLQALVGELGEAANLMKKRDRGDFSSLEQLQDFKDALAKELADVQIYLDLLAAKESIDLGWATQNKFNEVSRRVGSNVFIQNDDYHFKNV